VESEVNSTYYHIERYTRIMAPLCKPVYSCPGNADQQGKGVTGLRVIEVYPCYMRLGGD